MTLEVTRAGPDDMAALLPMVTALAAHHGDDCTADLETIARDLTGPAACGTALIGRRAGTAEGYAVLFPILEIQAGRRGMVLHHLFVDANARGLGLGKALIAACVVHARQ
ncbi:MAG: GNAT family N-acetyltransferase, partial [Pseudomonadota bacterium]